MNEEDVRYGGGFHFGQSDSGPEVDDNKTEGRNTRGGRGSGKRLKNWEKNKGTVKKVGNHHGSPSTLVPIKGIRKVVEKREKNLYLSSAKELEYFLRHSYEEVRGWGGRHRSNDGDSRTPL